MPSRRGFLSMLGGKRPDKKGERRYASRFRLDAMGELPLTYMSRLIPILQPRVSITHSRGMFYATAADSRTRTPLMERNRVTSFIIDHMDGKRSLGEIAAELTAATSLDRDAATTQARVAFLSLVRCGAALPLNSPDRHGTGG